MKKIDRRAFIKDGIAAGAGLGLGVGAYLGLGVFTASRPGGGDLISRRLPASHGDGRPGSLPNPHGALKEEYQVVIIGSGYGGSILGARLATKSRSICILERGKEWLAGDFPKNFMEVGNAERTAMNPLGLIDMNVDMRGDLDVIAGCGLGGTSLLNAAITIRPEDLVFQQPVWPKEIREEKESGKLDEYYSRAERILKPSVHPKTGDALKVRVHCQNSKELGVPWGELTLNVNHTVDGGSINDYGVPQSACTLCGNCCSGCNVGAKNSTNMNYLPLAKSAGAEIYTGMEVTTIEKINDGYKVHYTYHRGGMHLPQRGVLKARNVVVSAGSMGTAEILLRSKLKGTLKLSRKVGSKLSINGDVLGFSYAGRYQTDILGYEGVDAGQAIQSYADYRKIAPSGGPIGERFLLLDGTVPTPMAATIAKALATFAMLDSKLYTKEQMAMIKADLMSHLPGRDGALNHSMLYLACGHDSSGGEYKLAHAGEHVYAAWSEVKSWMRSSHGAHATGQYSETSFGHVEQVMAQHAEKQGGVFIRNPRETLFGGKRLQGTHPLGGAPMGEDADQGACDHRGRVYDGEGSVHRGLYIADGSMIPHSLGATPLITISALSERIAEKILESGELS